MSKEKLYFKDLVMKTRSYRRFRQNNKILPETLEYLIDLARNTPSARNAQPLKYVYSCDPIKNSEIFSCLKWAGALPDWDGPAEGEKPGGYIIMLLDTEISANPYWDPGIALQTIMLGASDLGLAGCPIASIESGRLSEILELPETFTICLVLAIGIPGENVSLEKLSGENVDYWRDEQGDHHVPKRALEEIICGKWI
jgi:nitroreductase